MSDTKRPKIPITGEDVIRLVRDLPKFVGEYRDTCFCDHFKPIFNIVLHVMAWIRGFQIMDLELMVDFIDYICDEENGNREKLKEWYVRNPRMGRASCTQILLSMAFNFCTIIFDQAAYAGRDYITYGDFILAVYKYGQIGPGQWPWGDDN
jgi:hypothetical protein